MRLAPLGQTGHSACLTACQLSWLAVKRGRTHPQN